jgi:hypothetical protein
VNLGIEIGEITVEPDVVVRAPEGTDPKALNMVGKVVVMPDNSVWINRGYRGQLAGFEPNYDWISEEGQRYALPVHTSTQVRWYRELEEERKG